MTKRGRTPSVPPSRERGAGAPGPIRCAIYTRKSNEEGLELEFNSLDAQREAAEAYIASQRNEGWICLPGRYDDGGFSGGSMERPALEQLLKDIEAGKVDCVVVYKVDRLSRSLILAEVQVNVDEELTALKSERASIHASFGRMEKELQELVADRSGSTATTARLAAAHERVSGARTRLAEVETRLGLIGASALTREEAHKALNEFDGVWAQLSPREQGRMLKLLFSKIEYDAENATVAVTFRATGIAALCARRLEEAA